MATATLHYQQDYTSPIHGLSSRLQAGVVQMVKNMPAMQEIPVRFLHQKDLLEKGQVTHCSTVGLPGDQEDPLEKRMITHPTILAWRTAWTEEPMGSQRVGHD